MESLICALALLDAACLDRDRNAERTCLNNGKLSSGAQILEYASMALEAMAEDVMQSITHAMTLIQ